MHINVITSISSNIKNITVNTSTTITQSMALDILRANYIEISSYLKYDKLQIYIKNETPYLVHTVDAISMESANRYMVDAHTGMVIDIFPLIYEEGPVMGSGINLLNESVDSLNVYEGDTFKPIGDDLTTPYLLCEEYCFDYGDCGGDN